MSMTIRQILNNGQEMLEAAGKDGAAFDARALLSFVMGIPFRDMPLHYGEEADDDQRTKFSALISRRLGGEPLQYITGEQEFMGLTFHVDSRVLIPRLDTEILAEEAVGFVKQKAAESRPVRVLDICCGSGAIGLSVAKLSCGGNDTDAVSVVLSDISEEALEVAKENAEALGIADRVSFVRSDLFDEIPDADFDLITANPPYIRSDVIGTLDDEVKAHEPRLALDGGADGMDAYRRIISEAPDHLKAGGRLMMETGFDQAEDILAIMAENGRYRDPAVKKDLAGLDRVVSADV